MKDPGCHCAPVRVAIDELTRNVEQWATIEQPAPDHIDKLTADVTSRIRFAALAASAAIQEEGDR